MRVSLSYELLDSESLKREIKMTNKIISGWYGKNGVMSDGWDSEAEAQAEFNEFYTDDEYADCEIIERSDGKWVIAY